MNVLFFGPPGAGKGTQAKVVETEYRLVQLSTGDMLRAEQASGSDIGRDVMKLMEQGLLVPDETVNTLIASKVDSLDGKGFIFDGYPRTIAQAEALDKLLADRDQKIDLVLELQVDDAELFERINKRARQEQRADDAYQTAKTRLALYRDYSATVLPYYNKKKLVVVINGQQPVQIVSDEIRKALNVIAGKGGAAAPMGKQRG